jgi:rubrerythrin
MSTRELQEKLVGNLERWQKVENASVASTGQIIAKTENPVVRLVMEIIQRDSQMHYRLQELIIDSLERKAITLTPDELADVWGLIEKHIEIEEKTIALAEEAVDALKDTKMVVQQYVLGYLLEDERKHANMLRALDTIKRGMYPYG